MKKKYKEFIEIDEEHMKNTIELSKLKLESREVKYEENTNVIWWSFFKKESLKYCLLSIFISVLLCLFSMSLNVANYEVCALNAAIISSIIFIDYIQSSIYGMEEILTCVKLNPARIFVYKSNIYLFVCLGCTLLFNYILSNYYDIDFMKTLLVSLVPMYLFSGMMLLLIDRIHNKVSLIVVYACLYVFIILFIRSHIDQMKVTNMLILFFVILSFVIYCFGIYTHIKRINEREGYLLWN